MSRKRMRRLMRVMGIEPIYPKPRLSLPNPGHRKYPYLLRDLMIEHSNQVWCNEITYISRGDSQVYLTAVMNWSSCYVIKWKLAIAWKRLSASSGVQAALQAEGIPEIFNTDQGNQFTGEAFIGVLKAHEIKISIGWQRTRFGQGND